MIVGHSELRSGCERAAIPLGMHAVTGHVVETENDILSRTMIGLP